jgi:putative oxidoreductase
MNRLLGRLEPPFFFLLRLVAGLLFACHGAQKLLGLFGGHRVPYVSQMGLAGFIELGCGILIAIGLLTRIAALIASGEMAVAYFQVHAPRALFPIVNQGEPAVLYCFLFLFIAAHGAGKFGLDRR